MRLEKCGNRYVYVQIEKVKCTILLLSFANTQDLNILVFSDAWIMTLNFTLELPARQLGFFCDAELQ